MSRETGTATLELTTTDDRLPVQTQRLSERGFLRSMVVVSVLDLPQRGGLWVEAGIMKGGVGNEYKCAVLVQDYVSLAGPGWWFGELPLDPTDHLYLIARASDVFTVRLTCLVEHRGDD